MNYGTNNRVEQKALSSLPYITFKAGSTHFALSVDCIRYIASSDTIKVREAPDDCKRMHTIFDFDGETTALYSFSKIIGSRSQCDEIVELIDLLATRKQDHIGWINSLEHSLRTGDEFIKATDPHRCAFGMWYDHYAPFDNELANIMSRFDTPHKRIHSLAELLLSIAKDPHRVNEAICRLENEKSSTLKELLKIFDLATSRLQDMLKPVIIILALDNSTYAIELDNIGDIRPFSKNDWLPDIKNYNERLCCYDGFFQTADHELFLKIDPQKIQQVIEYKWNESTIN